MDDAQPPFDEVERLERALAAQEFLRGHVSDVVVDSAIGAIRRQLDEAGGGTVARAQRRFATVLFADLAGFTAFADDKDPEVVAATMNELWAAIDAEIVRFGGRVDKHIGDAVMGVWGAQSSHESDPELAVRSALQIRARFNRFTVGRSADLGLRIGISTGPVFFSSIGLSGEWSVTGDTVNMASRMEHAAPPGGIFVSKPTWELLGDHFVGVQMPGFDVRGKRGSQTAYLVEGARIMPEIDRPASVGHDLSPLWGRADELDVLTSLYRDVVAGSSHHVTVAGEAGTGKTHLVQHFARALRDVSPPPTILVGRATEWYQHVPLSLLRDVLWRQLGVDADAEADTVIDRIGAAFPGTPGSVVAKWLGIAPVRLTGVDHLSGPELAAAAQVHVRRFIQQLASRGPVVLLLEDIHWADESSLDVMHDLAGWDDPGVLIVATSRSMSRRLSFEVDQGTVVQLGSLSDAVISQVVQNQLGDEVTAEQVTAIAELSGGNPLHAEEIARSARSGDLPSPVQRPRSTPIGVSGTLTGVLQSQIDDLEPSHRSTLQVASVVGRRFWDQAVVAAFGIDGGARADDVTGWLAHLTFLDFVRCDERSSFAGMEEFKFRHSLMRDAVYETVLLEDRPRLHQAVADWIREQSGTLGDDHAGELADHLSRAGDRPGAASVLARSAARALEVGAISVAVNLFRQSVDQLAGEPPGQEMVDILIQYGWALHLSGEPTTAERTLADAELVATDLELPVLYWRAAIKHARALMAMGDWATAAVRLDEIGRARPALGAEFEVERHLAQAALSESADDPGSGLADARRAAEIAEKSGLDGLRCRALGECGWSLFRLDRRADARSAIDAALEIAVRHGDIERQASLLMNQAVLSHSLAETDAGELDVAMSQYRAASELMEELGSRSGVLRANGNLAQAEIEAGLVDSARDRALRVLQVAWESNLAIEWGLAILVLAHAELSAGDLSRGVEMLGALVADPRVERWDDQIDRIFSVTGVDRVEAWATIRAPGQPSVDAVVGDLLASVAVSADRR